MNFKFPKEAFYTDLSLSYGNKKVPLRQILHTRLPFQAGTDTYCSNLYLFSFLSFLFEKKSLNFEYDTAKCDI